MKIKNILLTVLFSLTAVTAFSGCNLIFEPASDAVDRMMYSMPTGDPRVVRELCDGEDVCGKLMTLYGIIKSQWYNAQKGFFTVKSIEIAEDTGHSYVYVDVKLPDAGSHRQIDHELVFEMERIKLRWHIYNVIGIEEFIRHAQQSRGIL